MRSAVDGEIREFSEYLLYVGGSEEFGVLTGTRALRIANTGMSVHEACTTGCKVYVKFLSAPGTHSRIVEFNIIIERVARSQFGRVDISTMLRTPLSGTQRWDLVLLCC